MHHTFTYACLLLCYYAIMLVYSCFFTSCTFHLYWLFYVSDFPDFNFILNFTEVTELSYCVNCNLHVYVRLQYKTRAKI